MGHFRYARHFLLMACFGVLLVVAARLDLPSNLSVAFAAYGALHAAALVLALRAPQPIWRQCLFIVIAAILSLMTFRLGMRAWQMSGTHSSLSLLLAFSAAVGAAAYGMSIRLFGFYLLTPRSLAALAAGCALAELASLGIASQLHVLAPWWFALWWWFAFSGGLWLLDHCRRHRAE